MSHQSASPVYIIDTSIYIFRAYFAIPDHWQSPDGYSLNAVYGYTQFLIKFLQQTNPTTIAAAFDESLGTCFRNEIYADYKISRVLPDEDLAFQLAACKSITELLGLKCFASERYEADDIIATVVAKAAKAERDSCIVSRDKDLGQLLLRDGDVQWDYSDNKKIDRANFADKFFIKPEQMVDYLALLGDAVDDIPGVPGIGKKTAAALLQQFESIEIMQNNLDKVAVSTLRGAKSLAQKLEDYREQIDMAKQLVALHAKVPLGKSLKQMNWSLPAIDPLRYFLEEIGLGQRFDRPLNELISR